MIFVRNSIFFSLLIACGEGQNPNGMLFVNSGQKDSIDHIERQAQEAYDQGDYATAKKLAEKAFAFNPESEATAVLLSYIHLSLAGIDPLQLARNMMNMNKTPDAKATTTTSTGTKTCSVGASTDAAAALSGLSCVIGMSEEDLGYLVLDGNKATVRGTEVKGDSSNALFKSLPIKLPKPASEARKSLSKTLSNIDIALSYICPFVDNEAKVLTDSRHISEKCTPSTNSRSRRSKSHFLWSMGHLTEAIAFNAIVLYTPSGSSSPSLVARSAAISAKGVSASDFITAIAEFSNVVDVILPVDSADTMLTAMFNDLDATLKGFGRIAGIPASVIANLESSITNLKKSTEKVTSAKSESGKNAVALKSQLTTAVAKQLNEKISTLSSTLSTEKKAEVCAAYKSITSAVATACTE